MAAKKTKKSLQPQSAPVATKLNLVALKPVSKTPETQTSSPSSVEPSLPVEPPTSVETPTSVDAPRLLNLQSQLRHLPQLRHPHIWMK